MNCKNLGCRIGLHELNQVIPTEEDVKAEASKHDIELSQNDIKQFQSVTWYTGHYDYAKILYNRKCSYCGKPQMSALKEQMNRFNIELCHKKMSGSELEKPIIESIDDYVDKK